MGYKVSIRGLDRVEEARKLKGWKRQDIRWCQAASVALSTLRRFRAGEVISKDTFSNICEAVGITDWQKVAQLTDTTVALRQDWEDAPSLNAAFYGRTEELQTLKNWIVFDKCRLVAIRGLTGIGKTSLIRLLAESLISEFEFIVWRSLYPNTLLLSELISDVMNFISTKKQVQEYSLSDLINYCREHRCLIILDDIQTTLEPKQLSGKYQQQFKDYQQLFEQMAQLNQSCLVIIGNEQPVTVSMLEERNSLVHSLVLNGLDKDASLQLLKSLNLVNLEGYDILIKNYRGNPFFTIY